MNKPYFIIAGSPRCGTTALYNYLNQHPDILMPKIKEVDFFNIEYRYKQGIDFYYSFFSNNNNDDVVLGEASPNYMHVEEVPERINKYLPNVKLIFILRDPVKRAYSHYLQKYFYGIEKLSFEKALMFRLR